MDKRIKQRAAVYQLIKLVDENDGSIIINTDKVKRIFNDEDDVVRIEYVDGEVGLMADEDFEVLNDVVLKWQSNCINRTCQV